MKKFIALLAFTALFVGCSTTMVSPIDETTTLEDLSSLGMPTVFVLAGTYCPHCVTEIPQIQTVWEEYGSDVAFWVQVVDGAEGKTFDSTLPQGYNETLTYTDVAGIECAYVPSWVILDAEGVAVKTSCGNEFGTDVMMEVLDGLLGAEAEVEEEDDVDVTVDVEGEEGMEVVDVEVEVTE